MAEKTAIEPFVKWAGGKRQLLREIMPLPPQDISEYCEPFLGGGALLLALQPETAIVNDINQDPITAYQVIRDSPETLIEKLSRHQNTAEHYCAIRALDRDHERYSAMPALERAARLIFLNKTCYNGLYRVNAQGEFNVPFG